VQEHDYALIRLWHATGGARGLRAVRLGRSLRIPRIAILEFLGSAPPNPGSGGFERGTGDDRGATWPPAARREGSGRLLHRGRRP